MYFAFVFEAVHPTKKLPEHYAIKVLAETKAAAMEHVGHSISGSGMVANRMIFVGTCSVSQDKGAALYEMAINKARALNEKIKAPVSETPVIVSEKPKIVPETPVIVPEKPKIVPEKQVQLSFSKTGQLW